jgi:hypothetical protein
VIEIEAIDMFVDSDPEAGDEDEGDSLISLRTPSDREFSRQIKEMGARWDDQAKEWRMVGNEATIKQISALCKAVFPKLPRRRNRLIATQVSTSEGNSWADNGKKATGPAQSRQLELVVRVEFLVNRTIKTYRRGQNLKWLKEFREVIELPVSDSAGKPGETDDDTGSDEIQSQYASRLQSEIRELELSATEAFEALLLGRKDAVAAALKEAGITQV